ncbi:HD domain-containing phosphohydrolase [Azohydromonas aeria]|uniref:HD domain-containing phosphohydrolase n=1 Tax=Azohydromonas aeria TaxID=2590212 RepID=UPI001E493984|nr:HD domain-containing phosphohydrolase [Azohydromonas aeria]
MSAPALPVLAEAVAADAGTAPFTVLCVDDEPNILSSLQRALRNPRLRVLTAPGGAEALDILRRTAVDLVISDMRMPGMDGAQLLEEVRRHWPDVMRMLLTGHADMGSTVAAINRGGIFRYVHKPWDAAELLGAVEQATAMLTLQRERDRLEALTQHQNAELQVFNRELEQRVAARTAELEKANARLNAGYLQSIKAFMGLLELRNGALAGHGRRVADTARHIARAMGLGEDLVKQVFIAGLVHDIGLLGLSDQQLDKPTGRYSADEMEHYRNHALRSEQALLALDDMHALLPLVRHHHEHFNGSGFPGQLAGTAIPLGARILAVADAWDDLLHGQTIEQKLSPQEARVLMQRRGGLQFDPQVLEVFLELTAPRVAAPAPARLVLPTSALKEGMVLAEDLLSAQGVMMLAAGHRLTAALITRLADFERRQGLSLMAAIQPAGSAG